MRHGFPDVAVIMISGSQFDALVKLMRGTPGSDACIGARAVLVEGLSQAEARRELRESASRSTICNAVRRYEQADQLMRKAYHKRCGTRMTGAQFDALVKLMRGVPASPATRAARRILVDGVDNVAARKEQLPEPSRATVHNTVRRYQRSDALIRAAYCK